MTSFGFYLLGNKGYRCLVRFTEKYGAEKVAFVVVGKDKNIKKDWSEELVELCAKLKIKQFGCTAQRLPQSRYDFAIGWRWLISDDDNLIVFHDSILPKYRGFAPLVNMLISGEKKIGVTALKAAHEYDCGNILDQESTDVQYPIKIADAIDIISSLYEKILLRLVDTLLLDSSPIGAPQSSTEASYSLWRNNMDYEINWNKSSKYILRFIHAVGYPYAGASSYLNGKVVRILDAEHVKDVVIEDRSSHIGKTIFMNSGFPTIVCDEGLVRLTDVVDEQGNSLCGNLPFRSRFGS